MVSNRWFFVSLLLVFVLALTACNGDDDSSAETDDSQIRRFNWDTSADTILFRLDEIPYEETEARIANRIPLCTIWGDGRLVWVNHLEDETEILEARLTDTQIRDFVEDVIGFGFYGWEDDIIPPDQPNLELRSMSLNLYDNARTVERYSSWPNDGFDRLYDQCSTLSEARALFLPSGGFVRAYVVEKPDSSIPTMEWGRGAPFKMADVAANDTPVWLEEPYYLTELWRHLRRIGQVYVSELGVYYDVALEVPGISRNAPPTEVATTPEG